jgi:hypothetical protein
MIELITHYLICVHCLKNVWCLLSLFGVRCRTIVLILDHILQSDIFLNKLLFDDHTFDIDVQEVRHHCMTPIMNSSYSQNWGVRETPTSL